MAAGDGHGLRGLIALVLLTSFASAAQADENTREPSSHGAGSIELVMEECRAPDADAAPTHGTELSRPLLMPLRRIAEAVPDELLPVPERHYPVSNEHRHDLFFPHISDLGGAFVGVGSDQCYTLAAVQRAELVWIVDYDPLIRLVHRMYGVLVVASDSADALVARFAPANEQQTASLLQSELEGNPRASEIVAAYRRNRARMHRYLRRAARNVREGRGASWLADPELYARVRALHASGRIIARTGDLNGTGTLRAVARAARRLGLPIRVLYLSNAEQFFRFGPAYRENLEALPTDARSIVLRTFREPGAPYPPGERWHYMVQPMDDLRARIRDYGYRHSREIVLDLLASRGNLGEDGASVVDARVRRRRFERHLEEDDDE